MGQYQPSYESDPYPTSVQGAGGGRAPTTRRARGRPDRSRGISA